MWNRTQGGVRFDLCYLPVTAAMRVFPPPTAFFNQPPPENTRILGGELPRCKEPAMFLSTVTPKLGSPELWGSQAAAPICPLRCLFYVLKTPLNRKTCLHLSLNKHCP